MSVVQKICHEFFLLIGFGENSTSHKEKLLSGLGAIIGIYAMVAYGSLYTGHSLNAWLSACFGASAVLLFAAPHGALSQPWPVLGGYTVSGAIGIGCQQLIGDTGLAAAVSVGLAITAMHYLRCLHPPGGAASLLIVTGGPEITQQGFGFLLTPLLLNASILVAVAVLFNALFPWRRYPAHLAKRYRRSSLERSRHSLTEQDLAAALHEMDSFMDITPEDLHALVGLADKHADQRLQAAPKAEPTLKLRRPMFRKELRKAAAESTER